jgi:hypothetical protein
MEDQMSVKYDRLENIALLNVIDNKTKNWMFFHDPV